MCDKVSLAVSISLFAISLTREDFWPPFVILAILHLLGYFSFFGLLLSIGRNSLAFHLSANSNEL